MPQHKESDFIIPTLLVLFNHPEGCPTETVKEEIANYIEMSEEDLEPYQSRSKSEPRYHQVVGNLISHKNPKLYRYIDRLIPEERRDEKKSKYIMLLNAEGKAYVESLSSSTPLPSKEGGQKEEPFVDKYDRKMLAALNQAKGMIKPQRDQKLAKEIIEISNYKCQYALLTGQNHKMFKASDGKPYAEAHHLIPMKAAKDFFPKNLDRAANLVCLCPNCHAKLHHGSEAEKRQILKVLYDHYIKVLNEDEGIFISFEKLLKKYY